MEWNNVVVIDWNAVADYFYDEAERENGPVFGQAPEQMRILRKVMCRTLWRVALINAGLNATAERGEPRWDVMSAGGDEVLLGHVRHMQHEWAEQVRAHSKVYV